MLGYVFYNFLLAIQIWLIYTYITFFVCILTIYIHNGVLCIVWNWKILLFDFLMFFNFVTINKFIYGGGFYD